MQADAAASLDVKAGDVLALPSGAPITVTATWRVSSAVRSAMARGRRRAVGRGPRQLARLDRDRSLAVEGHRGAGARPLDDPSRREPDPGRPAGRAAARPGCRGEGGAERRPRSQRAGRGSAAAGHRADSAEPSGRRRGVDRPADRRGPARAHHAVGTRRDARAVPIRRDRLSCGLAARARVASSPRASSRAWSPRVPAAACGAALALGIPALTGQAARGSRLRLGGGGRRGRRAGRRAGDHRRSLVPRSEAAIAPRSPAADPRWGPAQIDPRRGSAAAHAAARRRLGLAVLAVRVAPCSAGGRRGRDRSARGLGAGPGHRRDRAARRRRVPADRPRARGVGAPRARPGRAGAASVGAALAFRTRSDPGAGVRRRWLASRGLLLGHLERLVARHAAGAGRNVGAGHVVPAPAGVDLARRARSDRRVAGGARRRRVGPRHRLGDRHPRGPDRERDRSGGRSGRSGAARAPGDRARGPPADPRRGNRGRPRVRGHAGRIAAHEGIAHRRGCRGRRDQREPASRRRRSRGHPAAGCRAVDRSRLQSAAARSAGRHEDLTRRPCDRRLVGRDPARRVLGARGPCRRAGRGRTPDGPRRPAHRRHEAGRLPDAPVGAARRRSGCPW